MSIKTKVRFFYPIFMIVLFIVNDVVFAESVKNIATTSAISLGKVTQTAEGNSGRVIIFEERHDLVNARIEIAHMLLRLYKKAGLRSIGLEGAFSSEKINPDWAQPMSARDRLRVSARLLGDGELNSAEFMTGAFRDISVTGIDSESEYKQELDKKASVSGAMYLMQIAEISLSSSLRQKAENLIKEKKIKEAFDLIIDSDPWTKRMSSQLNSHAKTASAEETLQYLEEIEKEAKKRQVQIPEELEQGMKAKKAFFKAATARSETMASNIISLTKIDPKVPVAAIIGAAHTERMAYLLKQKSVAFAVIRPNALDAGESANNPTIDYERKLQGHSVDTKGLGKILGNQKKSTSCYFKALARK